MTEETTENIIDSETAAENEKKQTPSLWSLLFIPSALIFYEAFLLYFSKLSHVSSLGTFVLVGAFGLLLSLLCSLSKNEKFNAWLGFVLLEIVSFVFGITYFTEAAFTSFMSPTTVMTGAGGVVGQFSEMVLNVFKRGWPLMILLEVPDIAYLFLAFKFRKLRFVKRNAKGILLILLSFALLEAGGTYALVKDEENLKKYTSDYEFDLAVRSFGLLPALKLDLGYAAFGNPYYVPFVINEPAAPLDPAGDPGPASPTDAAEETAEYGYNELPVDWAALAETTDDQTVKNMLLYIVSQQPSRQNEYTGKFKGKNLIFITAEAFTKEVIDPVRTPTLYRLATKGIVFEDFYQPAWGGSTSSGEFSMMSGIIPTDGVSSIQKTVDLNMATTLGNQFLKLGYTSLAFHNGTNTFYSRNLTHENLGYTSFIAFGSGMEDLYEKGMVKASDRDMMLATMGTYMDSQPFCAYYMTISGHCPYYPNNYLAWQHWDVVKDMDNSGYIKAYHAMQNELEQAMTVLVDELERRGIADDTVIVIGTDHYPYGLLPGQAWDIDGDYLPELFGTKTYNYMSRDHNALIMWSGCLEDDDPIVISDPTYSLDVVPTLSNLFGLPYDSRLYAGRDVLSEEEALVIWSNKAWKSHYGTYDIYSSRFTPNEGMTVPDDYVDRMKTVVNNKYMLSKGMLNSDFLNIVFGKKE